MAAVSMASTDPSSHAAPVSDFNHLSQFLRSTLRSLHDDSRASPARGIPDMPVELVDIIADYLWLPQHSLSRELIVQRGKSGSSPARDSVGVTVDSMCTGGVYWTTQQQDDWTPALRALILRGWRIAAIEYLATAGCCDLQVTYRHPTDRQQLVRTAMRPASLLARKGSFELEEGERIRQVTVGYTTYVWTLRLVLETSRGRRCVIGSDTTARASRELVNADPDGEWVTHGYKQFRLMPSADSGQCELLAFHYGLDSQSMHNIGVYYHTLSDA